MTKKQQMQIAILNRINKNRTQGGWSCNYDDNGFYAIIAKEVPFTLIAFTPREGDEAEADAAFIANAPRMLEIINELHIECNRYREALAGIREVWAGAECGEPVHAQEAYAIKLCKDMYQEAVDALKGSSNDE